MFSLVISFFNSMPSISFYIVVPFETLVLTLLFFRVSISVITIKGTDCKLVEIGKMADQTGGQVSICHMISYTIGSS